MEAAREGGAEDGSADSGIIEVTSAPEDFEAVMESLSAKNFETLSAEISMVAEAEVTLDNDSTAKALRMIDKLEENDDVQNVYHNMALPEGFSPE
jgi:transcriptional/translational regulatory protein YebC/TACO1